MRLPTVVLRPAPQKIERIFDQDTLARLNELFHVIDLEHDPDESALDEVLGDAFAVVGQPDFDRERLARAPGLRVIVNVEGNFFPNLDYAACHQRGIYVLGCGPAYAEAVAEHSLGMALDLARGISREDRAFREGRERYVLDGNADAVLLRHSDVGIIGFGNLGRALRSLLVPFEPTIRVHDPWLPDAFLRNHDVLPASLEETLSLSRFLFILATVTDESQAMLGSDLLDCIQPGARVVLASRAAVVDFDALLDRVANGRFFAAIDVWPEEPVGPRHRARDLEGLVLSAHRAGGIPAAFLEIGRMTVDDLQLIARGLPPVRMQVAAPELASRYRNRPVG
jgi:phosphoglycerate dehydrogenase-like enzyme